MFVAGPDRIPAIVFSNFLLFLLSYTINAWPVFEDVSICPTILLPIISKIFESFINDRLTKHLDFTGLFSDL